MTDLDLVAMRSAAERFQAVASDESSSVSEYVNSYNAYTEAVGVDKVLELICMAEELDAFRKAEQADPGKLADLIAWTDLPVGGSPDKYIRLDSNAAHKVVSLLSPHLVYRISGTPRDRGVEVVE